MSVSISVSVNVAVNATVDVTVDVRLNASASVSSTLCYLRWVRQLGYSSCVRLSFVPSPRNHVHWRGCAGGRRCHTLLCMSYLVLCTSCSGHFGVEVSHEPRLCPMYTILPFVKACFAGVSGDKEDDETGGLNNSYDYESLDTSMH